MTAIKVRAFAKINLSLCVREARPDGFHEVRTILQAIDLSDRLTCEARRGPFEIVCSTPGVPADRTNLIWKAGAQLWEAAGRDGQPRDVRIVLEKRIPVKAGLGGGSSDAAAALVALRKMWKLSVADAELHAMAARLGSDVPYFLVGGTALGLGRGEEVSPLEDLPRLWVVLIVPPFEITTADAYEWFDDRRARTAARPEPGYLPGTWLGRVVPLANDLEPPVTERHPAIGALKDRLTNAGAAMAAMSGSGSTVFGVFTTAWAARSAARRFTKSGAEVLCARFLNRS
jgi:4-diphosphocytidyl-2-C-methyl-D-erythritol kinase